MISDEALRQFTGNEWLHSGDADFGAEIIDMATELLQLREEKRKAEEARAKSWEDAPEWAHWKATDRDGSTMLYEIEPMPCGDEWMPPAGAGRIVRFVGPVLDWETTLETRP